MQIITFKDEIVRATISAVKAKIKYGTEYKKEVGSLELWMHRASEMEELKEGLKKAHGDP